MALASLLSLLIVAKENASLVAKRDTGRATAGKAGLVEAGVVTFVANSATLLVSAAVVVAVVVTATAITPIAAAGGLDPALALPAGTEAGPDLPEGPATAALALVLLADDPTLALLDAMPVLPAAALPLVLPPLAPGLTLVRHRRALARVLQPGKEADPLRGMLPPRRIGACPRTQSALPMLMVAVVLAALPNGTEVNRPVDAALPTRINEEEEEVIFNKRNAGEISKKKKKNAFG